VHPLVIQEKQMQYLLLLDGVILVDLEKVYRLLHILAAVVVDAILVDLLIQVDLLFLLVVLVVKVQIIL
tara:strand:+ start:52 stop:258 length:207 start_codon:yes stop_codon:yes gene_type:complete